VLTIARATHRLLSGSRALRHDVHDDGDDHIAQYYNGSFRLNGYFVVDDIHWLHQGSYFRLRSISREDVLLRTQVR